MSRLLALVALSGVVTLAAACGDSRRNGGGGCKADAECSDPLGKCLVGQGQCVECYRDEHCGCDEVCDRNVCTPMGAETPSARYSAHGIWQGTPGEANYRFVGFCGADNECGLGEICNPFTKGCVPAVDFQESCSSSKRCSEGLACDTTRLKCLPAATCATTRNCCGKDGLVCDDGAKLCLEQQLDCTPPAEADIVSTCPFDPRLTDECQPGLFCSPLGRCVQCVCDDDCDSVGGMPRCYAARGRCVPEDFCTTSDDCAPTEACDTEAEFCVPRCEGGDDCTDNEFCDLEDHVCRPLSDLPCDLDALEPNEDVGQATANSSVLPIPNVNESTTLDAMSLCSSEQYDWYYLPLTAGDRIQIAGVSTSALRADLEVFAPDQQTTLDTGRISDLGNELIDFVANFNGTYWLQVSPSGGRTGSYKLNVSRLVGAACVDSFENANGRDDSLDTARILNPSVGAAPTGCTVTGSIAATQTITCASTSEQLRVCLGDNDFFAFDAPAGASVTVTGTGSGGDLDARLYGPFQSGETPSTSRLADTSSSSGVNEELEHQSRTGGRYIVNIYRYSGENLSYNLTVTLVAGPACTEDDYDATTATPPPFDASGYNDTETGVSGIALAVGVPVVLNLTACRADRDLFQLGVDNGGVLDELPANKELVVTLDNVSPAPADGVVMFGDTDLDDAIFAAETLSQPTQNIFARPTTNTFGYLVIRPKSDATGPFSYRLTLTLSDPPVCADDGLGDVGATTNNTPATAYSLAAPTWPDAIAESNTATGLSACISDDDWYELPAVPAGAQVLAWVKYDPTVSELGLGLFDNTVASATHTAGVPPTTGRVGPLSELNGTGFNWVRGTITGDAYMMAYNRGGWPVGYDYGVELLAAGCAADSYEPNDGWAAASAVPLTQSSSNPRLYTGFLSKLSMCGAITGLGDDWFKVPLGPGDTITATMLFSGAEGISDMYFCAPGPTGVDGASTCGTKALATDWTFSSTARDSITIEHTVAANGATGDYLIELDPWSATGGTFDQLYFLDVRVLRACAEDALEPSSAASPRAIAYASLPFSNSALALCRDRDVYVLDVTSGQTVTFCATFNDADGNIDMTLFSDAGLSTVVGGSQAATAGSEKATYTAGATPVYVELYAKGGDTKNIPYTLDVVNGSSCP